MNTVVGLRPLEQSTNLGWSFELATAGSVTASGGTLNLVLRPPANCGNPNSRVRGRIRCSAAAGGFAVEWRTGPTTSSGTATEPTNLNQNYSTRTWGGQSAHVNRTVSNAGTLLLQEQVGPGLYESPPIELAQDTVVLFRLTNNGAADAAASLGFAFEMV